MSDDKDRITRRQFIAAAAASGAALAAIRLLSRSRAPLRVRSHAPSRLRKGISIVHGHAQDPENEPEAIRRLTRAAVEHLGGMDALVTPGSRVVIKPNMAWAREPRFGASTNPWVVAALVEMCREARAGAVLVMDNTISRNPEPSYRLSGIAEAARAAGARVPHVNRTRARELPVPDGFALSRWPFCEEFVSPRHCDVLINVPVLKDHGTSRLTIGLKNAFGMVDGERGKLHPQIHSKIPDLHRVVKVDLTIMDAWRVMRRHGPTGGRLQDVDNSPAGARRIVAGTDPVAVDAYGAHMFDLGPQDVGFVARAQEAGLGTADWRSVLIREESL